ncbi:MAG: hypothetical protein ACRD5Z_03315 [Bryobacteraceae bacterium]
MLRRALLFSGMAASAVASCGAVIDGGNGAPVHVDDLDDQNAALRAAFNAAHGKVRLLFVVGPTCGPCLRGLIDMNANLGANLLSDRRLAIFVVHVPTLSAQRQHAERAAQLIQGDSVHHYWDSSGQIGRAVQRTLQIAVYVWDVWLTYGPEANWDGADPPPPVVWSHQLGGLAGRRLDPQAVAADVRARVERLH